ncbi:MAG: ABC transporter ATP-binding protein [Rhodospirillales bacterium]|nr:ABC transporter ATP-binding protein [Rhodospirillales bacterium]
MTPPFLAAAGVHAFYGSSHVLHGIDLAVGRGEALALMGRNGMGKTTTIRALFGLTPPSEGDITIAGERVRGWPTHRIARLGLALVPEGRGIFPTLSVREHLVLAKQATIAADTRPAWDMDRVLELFPALRPRLAHMGDRLSGGEQQMLSIGRALMANPTLLVLDEATEGLSPLVRDTVWSVIRRIKAAGVALLIVDKDMDALLGVADRCLILSKGRVVYSDTPAHLAAHPEIHLRHLGV